MQTYHWILDMYAKARDACGRCTASDIGECVSRSVETPIRMFRIGDATVVINIRITAWDIQATVSYSGPALKNVAINNGAKTEPVYWLSLPSWPSQFAYGPYTENNSKFSFVLYLRNANEIEQELLPFLRSLR